jgi:RNA recognition motif-containing protein
MGSSSHSSSKSKKDKPSKKRKASTLDEPSSTSADSTTIPPSSPVTAPASEPTATEIDSKTQVPESEPTSQEPASKKRKAEVEEIEVDVTAPEPPSKKELRRLKKGKPVPASKTGGGESAETSESKKKAEVEKRSEHGVSKADLRKFFVDYSDITDEMITRVHMPGPDDKKSANKVEEKRAGKQIHNKGFAYVDFSSADAVEKAIELSEQLLSGRRVLIKNHKSFEGRPEKTKEESRNEQKPPSKRVFLGNLSFDTTEESLKEHFAKCGAIESVKVATFEDSGKCKGYAWVVFEDLEAAAAAVRGFVRIEEPASEAEDSEDEDEDEDEEKPKAKPKTRKWWLNMIKGRKLRAEFAEDAQVRYSKRFGKDAKRNNTETTNPDTEKAEVEESGGGEARPKTFVPAKAEYRQPYAPRLTGGIVESKGKKITF